MNEYQQLFEAYVKDMRDAISSASSWWSQLCANDPRASERWPLGPASHPFVLHVYRSYGLTCQALNDEIEEKGDEEDDDDDFDPDDESAWGKDGEEEDENADLETLTGPIEPRELLLDFLPGRADDVHTFLQDMAFDPLGMDADDRWV